MLFLLLLDDNFSVGGGKRKQGWFNFTTKGRHSSLAREKMQG